MVSEKILLVPIFILIVFIIDSMFFRMIGGLTCSGQGGGCEVLLGYPECCTISDDPLTCQEGICSSIESTNCVGSWSDCSTTCTEVYNVTSPLSGSGEVCEAHAGDIRSCSPGKDDCPGDTGQLSVTFLQDYDTISNLEDFKNEFKTYISSVLNVGEEYIQDINIESGSIIITFRVLNIQTAAATAILEGTSSTFTFDGEEYTLHDVSSNNNCVGDWSECTSACKKEYTISVEQSGSGDACDTQAGDIQTCSPGEGACPLNTDCVGTWGDCTGICGRIWAETTAQSGTGKECPTTFSPCQPGEDACPSDCEGEWSICSTTCTSVWIQARHDTGSPCPNNIIECKPGQGHCPSNCSGISPPANGSLSGCTPEILHGSTCNLSCSRGYTLKGTQPSCNNGVLTNSVECIKNIDCVGNWSQCTTNCEEAEDRVWITETYPSGEGSLCPTTPSVDCEQGDGDCGKRESCENYNCEDRQRYEHWDNELDKWSTYSSKWDYPTSTPTCNDIECVEQQEGTTKEAVSTYYADLNACCIKDYDCVQDPLLPCSQSCETGIQRIPRVIRKNSGKGEECPHLSPPTCSPGDGDCPRDCDGTWGNCTKDCERIWTEIKAQSGTGKACPSAPTCSPGEDYCPRNCEGKWSACSTTCTSIWEQTQAHHGTGSPCPNDIIECPPGKDECPPNIDCFGVWSDCNDVCFKEYTILTPNEGNGLPCPIPVAGDNSVYPERLSQFVKSGSQREPMYGVALCEGQIGDIDCSREFSKLPINEQDRNACYNINVSCNYSGKLGRICENDECVEDNSKTSSDYTRRFAESDILDTKDDEVLHNILEEQGVNTSEVVGWRRVFYANNYETIHTIEQRLGNALPTDMDGLGVNSLTPGPWSNWKVDGEVRNGMTPLELSGLMYQPYHFHKACDKYSTTLVLGKNRSAGKLEREIQAMEEEKESLSQQISILTTQRNAIFATQYGDWDLSRRDLPVPVQRKDDEIKALRDEQVVLIESLEELKVALEDKNRYDGRLHRTGSLGRVLEVSTLPPRRGGEYIFGGYTNTSWAVTPFEYKLNSDELNYTDNEMKLAEVNSISSESSAHQDYANKTYLDTTTLTNFNNLLDTPATCVKKSPSYDLSSSTLGRNPRHQESDWRLSVGSGWEKRTLQKDARLNDAGGLQDAPELPDHCTTASIDSHWGSDYRFNKGKESVDQCSPDCNWVPWNNVWNGQFIFRIRGPSRGPIVFEANPNFKRESLNKPLTCIGSTSNINHNSVECTQDGCTFHWDTDMWSDFGGGGGVGARIMVH